MIPLLQIQALRGGQVRLPLDRLESVLSLVTGLQVGAYNVVCCLLWPYSETCVQKLLSRKQNFALIKLAKLSAVLLLSKLEHDPGIIKIKSRPAPQMFINGICVES